MASGTIACLCGAINTPLASNIPGPSELCHCNPCRHTSGALFAGWISLDGSPDTETLSKCTLFHSSDTHTRFFCSACGSKVFVHGHHQSDGSVADRWHVFAGVIDPPPGVDNVLNIDSHCWLDDTIDGGMAPFMTKLNGKTIPCYKIDRHSADVSAGELNKMGVNTQSGPSVNPEETLKAECRCGGISLRIQSADHSNQAIPHLDRFIPKDSDSNPTNKHMAFCCVCRYCRQQSGVPLTPWTYLPRVQILNAHTGKPVAQHHDASTPLGNEANTGLTLKHYWSSERACWSFCYTCGASAFYSTGTRLEIINVAAGLLRADEGVMARRWLSWQWGRTAWKDEATQKDVTDAWRATAKEQ